MVIVKGLSPDLSAQALQKSEPGKVFRFLCIQLLDVLQYDHEEKG
jgi:hypothetical protein